MCLINLCLCSASFLIEFGHHFATDFRCRLFHCQLCHFLAILFGRLALIHCESLEDKFIFVISLANLKWLIMIPMNALVK